MKVVLLLHLIFCIARGATELLKGNQVIMTLKLRCFLLRIQMQVSLQKVSTREAGTVARMGMGCQGEK
ncbi:hypothetical protein PVC01_080029100 [Plasmodium vivax]|uniref:(malaria parasite P. vivax) hypothetical protein n=1 Tax=Plasmodium vivax TaxID=5855 RepID=A0A1G4HBU2_PLAVI|nr:unnamed protein product [Plasmodium vivax]SCO72387.1 hypothetical protein PVC01_080029100 [Plasmodium vivax]